MFSVIGDNGEFWLKKMDKWCDFNEHSTDDVKIEGGLYDKGLQIWKYVCIVL